MWGPGHPSWDARVESEFPRYSAHALIPLGWIEDLREIEPIDDGRSDCEAGIDVAGPGEDETTVCVRSGESIIAQAAFNDHDAVDSVIAFLMPFQRRLRIIRYDSNGIGHYFGRPLREAFGGSTTVTPVNVGTVPERLDTERFALLRDELYWSFRERCEERQVRGFRGDVLEAQTATIVWGTDTRGRIKIPPKKELPKSPDRFESVLLAFGCSSITGPSHRGPAYQTITISGRSKYKREF